MTIKVYEGDNVTIEFTVTDEATGAAKDLTGATIVCRATRRGVNADATVTVTDAVNGKFQAVWSVSDLSPGMWKVQARITLGSDTRTVSDFPITVTDSIFV